MIQTHKGKNLFAEAENFTLIHSVNFVVGDARDFNDSGKWNGKEATANAEEQRLNASEGEWDAKLERRAAPLLRTHVNGSLQAVHHVADHVHTDAAAGNFGDFHSGAEAGLKNQIESVLFAEALRF